MVKHVILQKKGHHFLLLEYPDRYHIITVNRQLDLETEEWILASVCPDSFFDDAALTRETIPKRELRGVAIGGNTAGSVLVLYRGKDKHQYVLSDDYDQAYIDEMFAGFERFLAPQLTEKRKGDDWRKEMQDPAVEEMMSIIGSVLNVAGCAHLFLNLFLGNSNPLWFVSGLLISFAGFALYLAFPQYYSLLGKKEYKRVGYTASVTQLEFAVMFPMLSVTLSAMTLYVILNWKTMLIWMATISIAAIAVLCCFSREAKENTGFLVAFSLVTILVSMGIAGQCNHVLNFNASEPQSYMVTDKEYRKVRKGRDTYECIVILEDGSELEVDVPRDIYHQIIVGDEILVYVGPGALGIEYAYFVDIDK